MSDTIRLAQVRHTIADIKIDLPPIRSSKDWRRYQVALKRMNARIEADFYRALFGSAPPPPSPTTYPPKHPEPRNIFMPARYVV